MPLFLKSLFIFLSLIFLAKVPLQACEKPKVINETTGAVFKDLQLAIDAANLGDILRIKGKFIGSFLITKNIILKGRCKAILDGARMATVLMISTPALASSPTTVAIENLTIQNGCAGDMGGGGILNIDANSILKSCKVINNSATEGNGGGILNVTISNFVASLTIEDSKIIHNAAQFGGGIANNNGLLDIRNSKIAFNQVSLDGGGIHSLGGTNVLFDNKISHNVADRRAGGFGNNVGSLTILNRVKVAKNKALFGGGIFNGSTEFVSTIILIHSNLHKNRAKEEGGGLFNDTGATAFLDNSEVKKNAAKITGGGILNNIGGILNFNDTKIKDNNPNNIVDL